jgi:hypothetical protein
METATDCLLECGKRLVWKIEEKSAKRIIDDDICLLFHLLFILCLNRRAAALAAAIGDADCDSGAV